MISLPGIAGPRHFFIGMSLGVVLTAAISGIFAEAVENSPKNVKRTVVQKITECEKSLPRDKTCVIVAVPKP